MTSASESEHGVTSGEGLNRTYVTKEGDTLEEIAAYFYGSSQRRDAILDRNPALGHRAEMALIRPGIRLRVPDEHAAGITLSQERGLTSGEGADRTYITKSGDTLEDVAAYFYGEPQHRATIERENPVIHNYDPGAPLPPGLTLRVPAES